MPSGREALFEELEAYLELAQAEVGKAVEELLASEASATGCEFNGVDFSPEVRPENGGSSNGMFDFNARSISKHNQHAYSNGACTIDDDVAVDAACRPNTHKGAAATAAVVWDWNEYRRAPLNLIAEVSTSDGGSPEEDADSNYSISRSSCDVQVQPIVINGTKTINHSEDFKVNGLNNNNQEHIDDDMEDCIGYEDGIDSWNMVSRNVKIRLPPKSASWSCLLRDKSADKSGIISNAETVFAASWPRGINELDSESDNDACNANYDVYKYQELYRHQSDQDFNAPSSSFDQIKKSDSFNAERWKNALKLGEKVIKRLEKLLPAPKPKLVDQTGPPKVELFISETDEDVFEMKALTNSLRRIKTLGRGTKLPKQVNSCSDLFGYNPLENLELPYSNRNGDGPRRSLASVPYIDLSTDSLMSGSYADDVFETGPSSQLSLPSMAYTGRDFFNLQSRSSATLPSRPLPSSEPSSWTFIDRPGSPSMLSEISGCSTTDDVGDLIFNSTDLVISNPCASDFSLLSGSGGGDDVPSCNGGGVVENGGGHGGHVTSSESGTGTGSESNGDRNGRMARDSSNDTFSSLSTLSGLNSPSATDSKMASFPGLLDSSSASKVDVLDELSLSAPVLNPDLLNGGVVKNVWTTRASPEGSRSNNSRVSSEQSGAFRTASNEELPFSERPYSSFDSLYRYQKATALPVPVPVSGSVKHSASDGRLCPPRRGGSLGRSASLRLRDAILRPMGRALQLRSSRRSSPINTNEVNTSLAPAPWHCYARSGTTTTTMPGSTATPAASTYPRHHNKTRGGNVSASLAVDSVPYNRFTSSELQAFRKIAFSRIARLIDRYPGRNVGGVEGSFTLPKIFNRNGSRSDSGCAKDAAGTFGIPIWLTLQRTGQVLPPCIEAAMNFLRGVAAETPGIFRKSGVKSRIQQLREILNTTTAQQALPTYKSEQAYDVADMVKQYFRDLPDGILTLKISNMLVSVFLDVPVNERVEALQTLLLLLPDENRQVLQSLLAFLKDIAAFASSTQMTAENVAVCFAPSVFHHSTIDLKTKMRPHQIASDQKHSRAAHECLTFMIEQHESLFGVPSSIVDVCGDAVLSPRVVVSLDQLYERYGTTNNFRDASLLALAMGSSSAKLKWQSVSHRNGVDLAYRKLDDGFYPQHVWRASVEVSAPPHEILQRLLKERDQWDPYLVRGHVVRRIDHHHADIYRMIRKEGSPPGDAYREYVLIRTWRRSLPRGIGCALIEMSINYEFDWPSRDDVTGHVTTNGDVASHVTTNGDVTTGNVIAGLRSSDLIRANILASRYLIQPAGAGRTNIVHYLRADLRGRSLDYYASSFGFSMAHSVSCLRNSFCRQTHHTNGPETKI